MYIADASQAVSCCFYFYADLGLTKSALNPKSFSLCMEHPRPGTAGAVPSVAWPLSSLAGGTLAEPRADEYAETLLPAPRGGCQETDRQTSERFTEPSPGPIRELTGSGRIKAGALSQELDHTSPQPLGLVCVILCLFPRDASGAGRTVVTRI